MMQKSQALVINTGGRSTHETILANEKLLLHMLMVRLYRYLYISTGLAWFFPGPGRWI